MLFRKWRIRKLSSKMNHCVKVISEIDEWLESSDDAVLEEIESLRFSRVKAQAELERLTWKYIELKQKYPHKIPPFLGDGAQWDSFNNVKKKLASQRLQTAGEYRCVREETLNGIANSISKAYGVPADELMFTPTGDGWYHIKQVPFDKIVEEKVEESEDIPNITLKDLETPMKDKMVEEDPGLQGDLAMLLHKLRDPANHPVSLLALAYQVAQGQCPDAKLIALALEMLVEEYREGIGPARDFEMSDKACLEALDVERSTVC